jgi:glutaredoxin
MKITNLFKIFFLTIILVLTINSVKAVNQVNIYFFHDEVCYHCSLEEEYLDDLILKYDNINVIKYEVTNSDEFNDLFSQVKEVFNDQSALTPYTVIGGIAFRGFNDQTEIDIENTIEKYSDNDFVDIVDKILNNQEIYLSDFDVLERDTVKIPIIGEVKLADFSLLVGAIVIGFVDGFNPCAMWVLIFLITMLVNAKDRKRMWILGFVFLFTSALVYFIIMMSWLQIALQLTMIKWFRYLIGAFAVIFGLYNLFNFIKSLKEDDGCVVTEKPQREKLLERAKKIVKSNSLGIAIIGIIALAATVNLLELACSAGLPLLYTQILAYNDLSSISYLGYVSIYIFFFLLDDLLIFSIAMITMKVTGISTKYTKYSHLVGGLIMVLIGILLIFFPNIIMFN